MGKYKRSEFLNDYSDWHWKRAGMWSHLTDIDRIFIEVRNFKPKIITDIKREGDKITPVEKATYKWFEEKGIPVFIVQPDYDFKNFKITRFRDGKINNWSEWEYIEWLQKI